jgi:hypothetical protein
MYTENGKAIGHRERDGVRNFPFSRNIEATRNIAHPKYKDKVAPEHLPLHWFSDDVADKDVVFLNPRLNAQDYLLRAAPLRPKERKKRIVALWRPRMVKNLKCIEEAWFPVS